jgi:hypothetical protein
MFAALAARNAAQTSPDDKWIPMPWSRPGIVNGTDETYYTLQRMDPRLVGHVFGPTDAESDGTLIICQEFDGKWHFELSGTPRKSVLVERFGFYSLVFEDRRSSGA